MVKAVKISPSFKILFVKFIGHKREWKLLHRYGYHMLALQDGTRINVSVVSQPCTSSV